MWEPGPCQRRERTVEGARAWAGWSVTSRHKRCNARSLPAGAVSARSSPATGMAHRSPGRRSATTRSDAPRRPLQPLIMTAVAILLLQACGQQGGPPEVAAVATGDPERGRSAISQYGCGACHTIPGVAGADGTVGPPLARFAQRDYIAGELRNTPENLVRWIQDPPAVEPRTAMPNLGVTEADAHDIAAYLYTLK